MALPHMTPIAPIKMQHAFDDAGWIFEPKFDGYRGVLYIDGELSFFRSKNNKPLPAFDKLADNIRRELGVTSAIIDGEITVLDPLTGYSDFNALLRKRGTPVYMAFDLLWLGGQNRTSLPLMERKKLLNAVVRKNGWIKLMQYVSGEGKKLMYQIIAAGFEGLVAKEKHGIYSKNTVWRKVINPGFVEKKLARARMFSKFRARRKA